MKIVSWNVNGLRSNILNTGKFSGNRISDDSNLASIIRDQDPDIICFQETKCEELDVNESVYKKYWNSSKKDGARSGTRYSGTSVWSKVEPVSVSYNFPTFAFPEQEGRIIVAKFMTFTLINVYVPNAATNWDERMLWDEALTEYLTYLHHKGEPVVLVGDMNVVRTIQDIWLGKTIPQSVVEGRVEGFIGFTKEERDGFERHISSGYVDVMRELHPHDTIYTWWNPRDPSSRPKKGWRLDYFLVSDWLMDSILEARALEDSGLLTRPRGSDHCAILLLLDM